MASTSRKKTRKKSKKKMSPLWKLYE